MEHIRTRNDLINWLENNAPFKAIKRALQEGRVENLGAFESETNYGWIVKIISKFDKIWHIRISPLSGLNFYGTILIDCVPWEYWIGDKSTNTLYRGDHPDRYKVLRDKDLQEEI